MLWIEFFNFLVNWKRKSLKLMQDDFLCCRPLKDKEARNHFSFFLWTLPVQLLNSEDFVWINI